MYCSCELPFLAMVLDTRRVQHQLACCIVVLCGSSTASKCIFTCTQSPIGNVKSSLEPTKLSQLGSGPRRRMEIHIHASVYFKRTGLSVFFDRAAKYAKG